MAAGRLGMEDREMLQRLKIVLTVSVTCDDADALERAREAVQELLDQASWEVQGDGFMAKIEATR